MNIVSFGGGTNSTAMIIGMHLRKIPIDYIIFADTGAEQPHTYDFIETFNEWLQNTAYRKSRAFMQRTKTETDCFLKKNASIAKRFRRLRSASRLVLKNTKYAHPKSS